MDIRAEEISKIIRDQIGSHAVQVDVAEVGSVISLGDGIARVHGVERAMAGEMLEFEHGVYGIALNLLGVLLITGAMFLLIVPQLGISLDSIPDWALPGKSASG